ncbi:MAG: PDGLE domain-containing protein [Theionarchaea archaeon]|nr:PDGLE domain-containing protein [Theionarchaea archaeon]MBU7000257.1 PDGLE domain-containing protein [Theionarchaea archaeon]MBU7022058.1 PDGLE domain-containing protein [Theionarchaea archaeon]MBU7034740.1 PDGLE domain-containing protein [Theionarchaea archaeon]MBU7040473.1 PDGLE domain-containing protein [Theionarchaea archaeon]
MKWWHYSLGICLLIGGVISLFASGSPDGLEKVAEENGFVEKAEESTVELMPDYTVPVVGSETVSASLAGIIGVLVIFSVAYGAGTLFRGAE